MASPRASETAGIVSCGTDGATICPARPAIALNLNESRAIDVLIDSERPLEDARIRIVAIGSVAFCVRATDSPADRLTPSL